MSDAQNSELHFWQSMGTRGNGADKLADDCAILRRLVEPWMQDEIEHVSREPSHAPSGTRPVPWAACVDVTLRCVPELLPCPGQYAIAYSVKSYLSRPTVVVGQPCPTGQVLRPADGSCKEGKMDGPLACRGACAEVHLRDMSGAMKAARPFILYSYCTCTCRCASLLRQGRSGQQAG